MTECICGYRNGTTQIANDGVIRSAEKGNITVLASTTVDLYFLHYFHLDSSEVV